MGIGGDEQSILSTFFQPLIDFFVNLKSKLSQYKTDIGYCRAVGRGLSLSLCVQQRKLLLLCAGRSNSWRPSSYLIYHEVVGNSNWRSTAGTMTVILLLIDPQIDFHEGGSLAVPGATADSQRIAKMITEHGDEIDEIYVTLDSHHVRT